MQASNASKDYSKDGLKDGLKVIGAGFGRTGTSSLKAALERLGFGPCYHMTEVFGNPSHAAVWRSAARGEVVDWREFLAEYGSVCDWPACSFYEELLEEYPEAKVILTVREPEGWRQSVLTTIYEISTSRSVAFFTSLASPFKPHIKETARMAHELIWTRTFDGRFEEKEHAISVFERHNEEVKERVPPENLLVYNVKEGWGPLCEFLGVQEPQEPFPRLNDAKTFRRAILASRVLSVVAPLVAVSLVFLALRRLSG